MRHVSALSRTKDALERMEAALLSGEAVDLATIDLNIAIDALGEITGQSVRDDIVATIFDKFCVGK